MKGFLSTSGARATAIATLIVPVCGVLAARVILPQPASAARKASGGETDAVQHVSLPDSAWLDRLTASPTRERIVGTPFPIASPADEPVGDEPYVIEPITEEAPVEPPPQLRVTAIMKSGQGHLALIDGKAARLGDLIEQDWVIESIDAQGRSITIRNRNDGRISTVTLDPPK